MQNKSKINPKMKPKTSQNIPDEDYLYFNTKEDEREAKSSIGVEYRIQHREFSGCNSDSSN
jgi:hypothetical protein